MAYIVWKDSFNIGVAEMDEQHRLLVGYINELYDAMQSKNEEAIDEPIFVKLTNYIKTHFVAEEYLLESINYPMFEAHKKQHAYFVSEITYLKSSFLNKTLTVQSMFLFLKDWFLHHITTEDQKYVEFIEKYDIESVKYD